MENERTSIIISENLIFILHSKLVMNFRMIVAYGSLTWDFRDGLKCFFGFLMEVCRNGQKNCIFSFELTGREECK